VRRTDVKGADLDEIEAVYRERFVAFARTATAIAGDAEAGRDAVQEAFAKAVRERHAFRREGTLEAWLWPIVVNEARDRARTRRPVAVTTGEPTSDGERSEDDALRAALAALPERQRLAAFLRYYADLDYEGISAVLGITQGTVGATLNAAHATLRRSLEEVRA
jgi:RNA polymerase sigma-70 factor (ECF subfamily)